MKIHTVNALNTPPRVTIDVVSSADPDHPQIEIRYDNVPGGWIVVVQMIYGALGAALPKAFGQMQQQMAQEDQKRVVLVPGMNDLHR